MRATPATGRPHLDGQLGFGVEARQQRRPLRADGCCGARKVCLLCRLVDLLSHLAAAHASLNTPAHRASSGRHAYHTRTQGSVDQLPDLFNISEEEGASGPKNSHDQRKNQRRRLFTACSTGLAHKLTHAEQLAACAGGVWHDLVHSSSQAGPTLLSDLDLALLYVLLHAALASRKAADNARCKQRSGSFSLMDPPLLRASRSSWSLRSRKA